MVLITAFARVQAQDTASAPTSLPPTDAEIRKALINRIDVEHWGTGIVVGVVTPQGRRVIAYGTFNRGGSHPVNGDTIFEIGSVTKVFTSLLLADMVQRGEVALTDPVAKYLPSDVKVPDWKGRQITLVDLSTQTSGLPFFPTDLDAVEDPAAAGRYTVDDLYRFLSGYELLHDIGVHWEYSNLGVGLLGNAMARRAGTDYETLVRRRITGPLGMKSTAIALSPALRARFAVGHDDRQRSVGETLMPAFAGAGALRSSANDLLTFLAAFLDGKRSALAPAMTAMLKTRRPGADWLDYLGGQQALGWWVFGKGDDQLIAHAGETLGFSCSIAVNPRTHVGVVVLSNGANGGSDMAMHLLRPSYPLSKPGGPAKAHHEIAADPKQFDAYVGKYQFAPYLILVIARRGDRLMLIPQSSPMVRLHAESERDYFVMQADVGVTFQVDANGHTTGLLLHLPGLPPIPAKRLDSEPGKL